MDPGRALGAAVARLTGIRPEDLAGAPALPDAMRGLSDFLGDDATLLGHNVGFDAAFLERAGLRSDLARLDTAELASIVLPTASSYALQRLATDEAILPEAAHRALHDALTCASVLNALARRARALPPLVLEECRQQASLLGPAYVAFFERALLGSWDAAAQPVGARSADVAGGAGDLVSGSGGAPPALGMPRTGNRRGGQTASETPSPPAGASAGRAPIMDAFEALATSLPGYEDRPEQRELADAIERTFEEGGVLVAEAGTGIGKSLAYLVPALGRATKGERTIVSTYTVPLQEQLVRKDLPALQAALGTEVPVAILKGRSHYLCPRRWQAFRATAATREEVRLALKTLVWRQTTATGDRAELNLMGGEAALWPRISSDDESCDGRRCGRVAGGCYLERAREAASRAGVVVVNHALLLYDARMRSSLLPQAEHAVVDEAHHIEDVAADVFGFRLEEHRVRRDLDRAARSPLVVEALRGERAELGEAVRAEVDRARSAVDETFALLVAVLPTRAPGGEDKLRITSAFRASDDRWLPVELAGERLADALAGTIAACDRLGAQASPDEEDMRDELASAALEVAGNRTAIARGIHDPRAGDIVWLAVDAVSGSVGLYVAPGHVGSLVRRALVERYDSVVMTSATLAVAGSLDFTLERFGVADIAAPLVLGSPFDHARQSTLIVPSDLAYPHDPSFSTEAAGLVADISRALGGRTLVLFTSHASLREVAALLEPLETEGIAVLAQGLGGSRRAIVERFRQGSAVLLGTQSFWEGVDLPGELLSCVVIAKLPFAVPDDPLVAGRSERYEDPFREFQVPQAALRLRQGFGRLIRTKTDRGAVVLLDRRVLEREYGPTFIASLPDVRLRRAPAQYVAGLVAEAAGRGSADRA